MTGPNGVGKTNLLEALHVGAQGFSPRTRSEPRLVRFGEEAVRFKLISPLRPGLILGESDDFLYLIMPIRLAG